MEICLECDILEKIENCCSSHPETGKTVELILSGGLIVEACPNLNEDGECIVYDDRPDACREYMCPRLYELDLVDLRKAHNGILPLLYNSCID